MRQIQYLIPVALIQNSENQILLIKKLTAKSEVCIDKWELPGGTIKFGQNYADSLKSKIKDYLGLDITVGDLVQTITTNSGPGEIEGEPAEFQFFILASKCQIQGSSELNLKEGKIKDAKWFTKEEILSLPEQERVSGDLDIINHA